MNREVTKTLKQIIEQLDQDGGMDEESSHELARFLEELIAEHE